MAKFPKCPHSEAPTKCFACEGKNCRLLISTRKLRTPCPFYKSLKQYLDDLEKYPFRERLYW